MLDVEEKNDDQILLRLPKRLHEQADAAARLDGISLQEWLRKAVRQRICLKNICPECGTVNAGDAKFFNQCGRSLKDSQRSLSQEWFMSMLSDEVSDMQNGEEVYRFMEQYFMNPDTVEVKYSAKGNQKYRTVIAYEIHGENAADDEPETDNKPADEIKE